MDPGIVLAIDPGPHMGFALCNPKLGKTFVAQDEPDNGIRTWELDLREVRDPHAFLYHRLQGIFYHHMVLERFDYRKDPEAEKREGINLDALEYIGVCKLHAQIYSRPCIMQGASLAFGGFWSDKLKLEQIGVWRGGQRHAMAAVRHLLYYLTFTCKQEEWLHKLKEN